MRTITNNVQLSRFNIILLIFFVVVGVVFRLTVHEPNFTPVGALALFSGYYLEKRYAWLVPIATLIVSDYFLGFYNWRLVAAVYGSFLLISFLGCALKKRKVGFSIFVVSIAGSILFFLITNFVVWYASGWYANDFNGLAHCYYRALPFFRNTVVGDLFFNGIIFSAYAIALRAQDKIYKLQVTINN